MEIGANVHVMTKLNQTDMKSLALQPTRVKLRGANGPDFKASGTCQVIWSSSQGLQGSRCRKCMMILVLWSQTSSAGCQLVFSAHGSNKSKGSCRVLLKSTVGRDVLILRVPTSMKGHEAKADTSEPRTSTRSPTIVPKAREDGENLGHARRCPDTMTYVFDAVGSRHPISVTLM